MSTKDKLIKRFLSLPTDFTYEEARRLFKIFGFEELNNGRTSGSSVSFSNGKQVHSLHKPHPNNELKKYQMENIKNFLERNGYL